MIAALSSLAGAALLTAAAGQETPLAPFPGVWNTSAAGCADPESQHGLVIEGRTVGGYEWGGEVVSVRWNRDNRATADLDWWDTSDVDANGHPITRRKTWGFSLSPDHQTLTVRFDDQSQTYVRCRRSRL
ncbi:MAG: hypothetical protein EBR82_20255 [Caulobacteraceae bacterium]|nr:hypothetical protein [Caulobacteraceae bacterium]